MALRACFKRGGWLLGMFDGEQLVAVYVSATGSRNAVDFYLSHGCHLLKRADPKLYRQEPEDIHLCRMFP